MKTNPISSRRLPHAAIVPAAWAVVFLMVLICTSAAFAAESGQGPDKAHGQASVAGAPGRSGEAAPAPGGEAVPVQTEALEAAGKKMGEGVDHLGKKAASVLGPWVEVTLWDGVRWLDILASSFFLAILILVERIIAAWLRAMARRVPAEREDLLWKRLFLKTIRPPISLMVLLYGTYVSLFPIFDSLGREERALALKIAVNLANIGGTFAAVWLIYRLVRAADSFMQSRLGASSKLGGMIFRRCRGPIQLLIMLVLMRTMLPVIEGMPNLYSVLTNLLSLVFIGTTATLVTQIVYAASDHFVAVYQLKGRNPFYIRKLQTQVQFLRRIAVLIIVLVAVATGMMVFDKVRQLGTSILASAGIAGVIIGVSAQRTIANLLVGLQIAITQPIRIGDIVTVEKETGTILEINSTFAIIQTWDQKSLIVPLTFFTEKHFQNLTLSSSELMGTVSIFVDYSVPVEDIRSELGRILENSPNWDGRSWAMSVANLKENAVELTAVVSASDQTTLGNLRGEVREKILAYLQNNFPAGLPKVRAELDIGKNKSGDGNSGFLQVRKSAEEGGE